MSVTLTAEEIKATIAPVVPFSDNDEAFWKGMGYSILALLWGKAPGKDNVDYSDLGLPSHMNPDCSDEEWDAAFAEQAVVAAEVYANLGVLLDTYGAEEFVTAVLSDTDYTPFWYVAVRWADAEHEYGPQPDGLTITETVTPTAGGLPTYTFALTHTKR